jgi:hypothetical protein
VTKHPTHKPCADRGRSNDRAAYKAKRKHHVTFPFSTNAAVIGPDRDSAAT